MMHTIKKILLLTKWLNAEGREGRGEGGGGERGMKGVVRGEG